MGDTQDHLQIAKKNQDFLIHTEKKIPPFEEWGATILFYIAIHYIEAYLYAKYEMDPSTHLRRLNILINNTTMPEDIIRLYQTLYNRSIECRYHNIRLSKANYLELKNNNLIKIIDYCNNQI
ncbi:MAG: hypothetical protein HZR80_16880 [Candidatus Heimdallarchaeota archaeon]